jgi:lysophospholipase L1-like esterase
MTAGGDYTAETTRYYACRAAVLCNATFAMTNVKMQYVVNDGKEDVWVFGDSYISLGDPNRWATQLVLNGHKNLLLCGFGGAMSGNMIADFRLMLSVIKPKYLCWFLGMNDGDSSSAVNTNWKTYVDEVIATCDAEGITLILATIPNVPNVINTFKNAYVKASGKRYVDFAKAVNGESTGATWYTGMLSSDNTHPTALGAKALMRQFILDVPEVLYSEE